jgi:hypothetical protein
VIALYEMPLQLDQLNLKLMQTVFVDFPGYGRGGFTQISCTDFPAHG